MKPLEIAIRTMPADQTTSVLRAILAASDHGVLLTDLGHQSLACNPAFGTLFGIDPHAVVRSGVQELRRKVQPLIVDRKRWVADLDAIYAEPSRTREDDLVLKRPAGEQILRRFTAPVADAEGRVIGRLWTFRDVTQERRIRRMGDVLHELSTLVEPNPDRVLRHVVKALSAFYGKSTAILSIRRGDTMDFRALEGPVSPLKFLKGNALRDAY